MTKIRSWIVPGLLGIGMIYALLAITPLQAYACTPTECADLEAGIDTFCATMGCDDGGKVLACNSTSLAYICYGDGSSCNQIHSGGCR